MTDNLSNLKFKRQPAPVMAEHRPLYKICQALLVLHLASRGGKSRLARLHLFNWALKTPEHSELLKAAAKTKTLRIPAWGFDPALAIALRYAIAEGLIREVSSGYELTDAGKILIEEVIKNQDIFVFDKSVLTAIGKNITEAMVEEVAKDWEKS
jgi:hypothetical protein